MSGPWDSAAPASTPEADPQHRFRRDSGSGRSAAPNRRCHGRQGRRPRRPAEKPESDASKPDASGFPLPLNPLLDQPGDRSAFENLVRDHQAPIWRYLRFLGCSPPDADDLTQETFLAVLDRSIDRFGGDGARAYLRRVARNAWLRRLERNGRLNLVDFEQAEAAYEWYRGDDDGDATRAALQRCLDELPERSKHVLDLKFADRLDRDAIAARLGLGALAVKSVLARAYARLRTCIERRLRDEPV